MEVVDASVMVAVFQRQDPFHQVSRAWFEAYLQAGGQFAAPLLLMSEVAGVIRRETGDPALARQAVQWLYAMPELHRASPWTKHLHTWPRSWPSSFRCVAPMRSMSP
jgi:predicted nucleic acid-binding protein